MALRVTVADGLGTARTAVRCPVCNSPVISGEPAGWFLVRCRKRACQTTIAVNIDGAKRAPYSSGPRMVLTHEADHAQQRSV